ncbi:MAG: GTPase Era [Spirochaetales bacterium]|jgi:GTP-binding protein Era|nr:GTPase Era [Spirochaetales bacterium]
MAAQLPSPPPEKSPFKAAFVALLGRPSSGKSTLINRLCGEKVSIVAASPQTTRNAIRGILNRPEGQLIFVDTPGYHRSEKRFNRRLKEVTENSLEGIDLAVYVLDSTRPPGEEEQDLAGFLAAHPLPLLGAVNKIDSPQSRPQETEAFLTAGALKLRGIFPISAATGEGVEELIAALFAFAPPGERMYPQDLYTDQSPEFRIREIIREKALEIAREEIPHALYVEIADLELKPPSGGAQRERLWVRAFLVAERESQKGILVGKGGANIRFIRLAAQKELNRLFPYRVDLDLRVKTNPGWRHNEGLLKREVF